jgi:hypothetical protein
MEHTQWDGGTLMLCMEAALNGNRPDTSPPPLMALN